ALSEWPANGTPRRAGVSSFGIGGTNVHVILEEAPPVEPSTDGRPWHALMLSAKTPTALDAMTTNLIGYLRGNPDCNLADVAYTLEVGRTASSSRRLRVVHDRDDASDSLNNHDLQRIATGFAELTDRPVVFLFPGQGAQYLDMGRELYQDEPLFRAHIHRCCE